MQPITLNQFIAMFDGAQSEDTELIINVDGEEITSGRLIDALDHMQSKYSNVIVRSFFFCDKYVTVECAI